MRKFYTLFAAVLMSTGMWALNQEGGYYLIGSAQELKDFAALVNGGNNTINGKLTANIDLQGGPSNQWTPIGNGTYPFNGTFDGQGFTISNLYYHQVVGSVGLFGHAGSSARIKNVRAVVDIDNSGNGATTYGGATSAGGILGAGDEGTLIINCSVAGSVISFSNVGGIVGLGQVTVVNSYNEATVKFYNNNGQVGGGIHGWGGPATLINCYNVGQIINTGPEGTSHMGNIAANANITNCYSLVNSCQNGAGAAWSNQAPNGVPGITMTVADMQAAAFTNTLYSNALALWSTYPDIDTWMQDPTTGRPILNLSYKPSEGPWTRIGENSGCCSVNVCQSISWNGLNNSQWSGTVIPFKDNTNGIGTIMQGTAYPWQDQIIFTLYETTQTVPSYSVMVWNWNFQMKGRYQGLAQQTGLYAHTDLSTLQSTALDFTVSNANGAGSEICIGLFYHNWQTDQEVSQNGNHNFWFDNRNGSTESALPVYMIQTHSAMNSSNNNSTFGPGWVSFKNVSSSYTYYYYKHITFNANGGSGSMAQQQIENSGNLTANAFTYAHKVFNGWSDGVNTYADGASVTATADSKGPVTLYAQWIDAPMATLTAPTAKSLTYNGSLQSLINAGSAVGGEMQYKVGDGEWSDVIPTATNAGDYTVYYRVVADDDHSDNPGSSVSVTISKDPLTHVVTIANNKYVSIAPGNLQYKASTDKWRFAEHQYDFLGANAGNTAPSASQTAWMDLFGWGTSGWNNDERYAYQPYSTSEDYYDYGVKNPKTADETLTGEYANGDWGVYNSAQLGLGWRTLTRDEWRYILYYRTTQGTVNSTSNAIYTNAKILTDGSGTDGLTYNICGVILFPDNFDGSASYSGVTWGTINTPSDWSTTCTTAGWEALESAGCIFLPAAGSRSGTTVTSAGTWGIYWTSTASAVEYVDDLYIGPNTFSAWGGNYRHLGRSVRLAQEIATAPTAVEGLVYTGSAQPLISAGTVLFGTMKYSLDNSTWSADIPTATNSGNYTVYYMIEGDANHEDFIPANNSVQATISKAPLTITADNKQVVYLQAAPTYTATYDGFVNSETESVLNGTLAYTCTYSPGNALGNYTITPSGLTSDNYAITFNDGTLQVVSPAAIVLPDNEDKTSLLAALNNQTLNITIGRTIYAGPYNTFCLPFSMSAEQIAASPLNGAILKDYNGADVTGTGAERDLNIHLTDLTEITAGKPFLVKTETNIENPVFNDVTITYTGDANGLGQNIVADYVDFQGLLAPFDLAGTYQSSPDYLGVGMDGRLYWADATLSTAKMRAFRAFFHVKATSIPNSPVRRGMHAQFVEDAPQTPTGVEPVTGNPSPVTEKVLRDGQVIIIRNGVEYTVTGQKLK